MDTVSRWRIILWGEGYLDLELEMYNAILKSGDMPAILCDVIIIVLYKWKGPRDICDNYRGISLMSHKGKLLERLILNRLKPALKDVIPANQFGFTEKCGTYTRCYSGLPVIGN